jgi:hypothetical protein
MSVDNDDSAGLPEGFSYMDPPPGWPPLPSAEELWQMALRLQQALERDTPKARDEA